MAKRTNLIEYLERARPSTRTSSLLGVAALALAGSAVLVNRLCAGGGGSAQGFARPVLLKDGAETELPSPPNL